MKLERPIFQLVQIPLEARIILQSILTCSGKYERIAFCDHINRRKHYSMALLPLIVID